MSDERQTLFVISFAGAPRGGHMPRYLAPDGSHTDARAQAAKFYSFETAKQFAAHHQISLGNDASIDEEAFDEVELASGIVTPDDF